MYASRFSSLGTYRDTRAGQPNGGYETLDVDTKEATKLAKRGQINVLNAVAALHIPSVALADSLRCG